MGCQISPGMGAFNDLLDISNVLLGTNDVFLG